MQFCKSFGALALLSVLSLPAFSQVRVASAEAVNDLPNAPGYLQQGATPAGGQIQGTVIDAHGALIPGASITLSEKNHPDLRETTSDSAGRFIFSGLRSGTYDILVSSPEFKTFVSPSVLLQPDEHAELPPVALALAASTSINVSADSSAVAEQELHRETQQRIVGIIPNFYTSFIYDAAPLNTRQKFKLSTHSVLDPTAFLGVAISAGIEQERDTFPGWGNSDAASYGKRYAAGYGDELLTRFFSYAIYPSIFHQDPRYFYLGPTNKTSTRIWHALQSGIITRGDNGHLQPNYSHMLGSASAGALSSVYHPASDSAGYLAALNFGVGIGASGVQALIREFVWPHFTTHVPKYATGKSNVSATTKP